MSPAYPPPAVTLTAPKTVDSLLLAQAEAQEKKTFLIFDGEDRRVSLTYGEMRTAALSTAERLASYGVEPGNRIHIALGNCPEFIALFFAAALLGAEIVPTNPTATVDDFGYFLHHSQAVVSVTEPANRELIETAVKSAGLAERVTVLDRGEVPLTAGSPSLDESVFNRVEADPTRELAILYTSGTTSRPKGVRVTHANYLHAGKVVAGHLELDPDDRWLVVLPLFHANAQYYCLMSALVAGGSVALVQRFSASRWVHQARRNGATVASLFAAPIRMILAAPREQDDADNELRVVLFAQRVDDGQLEEFEDRFGCGLLQLYGMTETVAPPLMNPLYGERRNAGIGKSTGPELKLVDPETGPGPRGELWVSGTPGTTIMAGYLDDPEATTSAISGDWLRTGDILCEEAGGWYRFEAREKDMIKSAGENIAAAEVERVIDRHPLVFESAVIGIPDPIRDEVVAAFVVLRPDVDLSPEKLIDWCRGEMVKFKVPAVVTILDELPRTSVGKVQKHRLAKSPVTSSPRADHQ